MFRYNFIIALRRLFKHKTNTAINILGLAVGLTSVVLMLLYIKYETTYDHFHADYDRLFRVERNYTSRMQQELWESTPYPLAETLVREFPEIEQAACIRATSSYLKYEEVLLEEQHGMFADNELLQLLTFRFKAGNRDNALVDPMSIVISASLAKRLSPFDDLLGKTIWVDRKHNFVVNGIFEDLPENSHLQVDYLLSFRSHRQVTGYPEDAGWEANNATAYLKVSRQANVDVLASKIAGFLDLHITVDAGSQQNLELRPIVDIYTKTASVRGTGGRRSDSIIIYLFLSVAIFTSLISMLNYVNASSADAINRELEIGIKKVHGISKAQLRYQFICESFLVVGIASLAAILLLSFTLPLFNNMIDKKLTILISRDWPFLLKIFLGVVLVGALSGLYPAFFLSSLKVSTFLQGNTSVKRRASLRKVLVVFQLAVVMPLIFTSILIIRQISFIENKDIGFRKENLLVGKIETPDAASYERLKSIKDRLLQSADFKEVSISSTAPFHGANGWSVNWEGSSENDKVVLRVHQVDHDFIDAYGMKMAVGRGFSADHSTDVQSACILNETAVHVFGWKEAVGKTIDDERLQVIGVVKDFNDFTLFKKIPPLVMVLDQDYHKFNYVSIRVDPKDRTTIQKSVNNLFSDNFPDSPVAFKFMEDDFESSYLSTLKGVTKIFIFFSIIAIVLAVLGLYSLVSYSLKTQQKMIAVRKVLGASVGSLFLLLLKEYLLLFSLAGGLGLVSVYFVSYKAMSVFAYHEEVRFIYLVLSALLALLVVLISVSSKIHMASKENPMRAIAA